MADYMTLLGSEQVQSAGCAMRAAAEEMRNAANTISESNDRLIRAMDEYVCRMEAAMSKASE